MSQNGQRSQGRTGSPVLLALVCALLVLAGRRSFKALAVDGVKLLRRPRDQYQTMGGYEHSARCVPRRSCRSPPARRTSTRRTVKEAAWSVQDKLAHMWRIMILTTSLKCWQKRASLISTTFAAGATSAMVGGSVVAIEGGYKALGVLWHCTRAQREVRMRKVVVVRKVV